MIGRDILGIEDLSREDIETILETAERMQEIGTREVKKVPTLRGRTLINLFFEPSTRTQTSFEIAGKRLAADVVNFSVSSSSVTKRETLLDTAKTLDAMDPDVVVVRHNVAGVPHRLAEVLVGDLHVRKIGLSNGGPQRPRRILHGDRGGSKQLLA